MSITCWDAPNVKYNMLENQKLNSTFDSITTEKYIWKPDHILASAHFSGKNYIFKTHAKFILIEQLHHVKIDTEKLQERLKQRENFWLLTLKTLTPKRLSQELN